MRSKRIKQFRTLFDRLPSDVQRLAHQAYHRFKTNLAHPGLDFKQVSTKGPTYSARIGIHYRALAIRTANY